MQRNIFALNFFADVLDRKIPDVLWNFDFIFEGPPHSLKKFMALDTNCGAVGCALGMSHIAFPALTKATKRKQWDAVSSKLATILGMPGEDLDTICGMGQDIYYDERGCKIPHSDVTRHMVANAFRRYANQGRWW